MKTGFAVIYQWRLKQGMEQQFHGAWGELTELLKQKRGARGSRLHRTDHGTLVAYAQWPDRAAWEHSCELHTLDEALSKQMLDAVEETWAPIFMTPLDDRLLQEPPRASQPSPPTPHGITH